MSLIELQTTWRDCAVNAALDAEARYGSGLDALVRAIREYELPYATYNVWLDRLQVMRFMRQQPCFQSYLRAAHTFEDDDAMYPYVGWYSVEWCGATVELAFSPENGTEGAMVCMGTDEAAVRSFVRALCATAIKPSERALRYARRWEDAPDIDKEIAAVTWDDLVLPAAVLAGVRDAVEGMFAQREAFAALGFGWKRGVLLIGPPGTGKTMICKAAAAALPELPFLYVRDLRAGREEDAIRNIFGRARALAPCILAFEDIDSLVSPEHRTTFLNELDGFENNEGLFVIASSNHPEKIDEALLKRPSRFDRVFHIGLPAHEERRRFCVQVLHRSRMRERMSDDLDREALAEQVARQTDGFTPAYLKEIFVAAALRQAQQGIDLLDQRFADEVLTQVKELKAYMLSVRDPHSLAELERPGAPSLGFRSRD